MAKFQVFTDESGEWRWRLRDDNQAIIASSGESFASRRNAIRAIDNMVAEAALLASASVLEDAIEIELEAEE